MKYKYKLGDFGSLVKNYERARRMYPKEVFSFLKSYIPKNPLVLDLGCGTGISTRQIAKFAKVIGCDPDPIMLRVAKKNKVSEKENYVLGSSQNLPFKDETFNAVTAFAAFHWFDDKKSLREIKRVLRPGGVVFIVNRVGARKWGEGYREAITKTLKIKVAHFKKGRSYGPGMSLRRNGFKNIKIKTWRKSELYTLKNALEYVQSVSIWNSVPPSLRPKALIGLISYFKNLKQKEGGIIRRLTVKAVVGTKRV